MKKQFLFSSSLIFPALLLCLTLSARADMLSGGVMLSGTSNGFSYLDSYGASKTKSVSVSPMNVTNRTTDQDFQVYCGDFLTSTSGSFGGSQGQSYVAYSLNSAELEIYKDYQRSMIEELFSYAHASAFDENGSVINKAVAQAIQLTVWEILMEDFEENGFGLSNGDFKVTNSSGLASGTLGLTNLFFGALMDDTNTIWSQNGYSWTDYDMTVYVAQPNATTSQTLISIKNSTNTTPEPATMLIFGLAAAGGLPVALRRRMLKK